jgi:cellulose synthase/poly-beta-1,6-N-acetylglucosamine synthase-like glycosyltransferase
MEYCGPKGKAEIIVHGQFRIEKQTHEPYDACSQSDVRLALSFLISPYRWFCYSLIQFVIALYLTFHSEASFGLALQFWALFLAELCTSTDEILSCLVQIFFLIFPRHTTIDRPKYKLISEGRVPRIDVFIPCCHEDVQVIVDTVAAVVAQDYPSDRFRVLILDDGADDRLKEAVCQLKQQKGSEHPELHYLSRAKSPGPQPFFKAGNLQFGLDQTKGQSEYFASLDADMIPDRDWLRRIIPHLMLDSSLALACPPQVSDMAPYCFEPKLITLGAIQRYYNVPESDPFGQQFEFDHFLKLYEVLDARLDPAMCTGSGFIARRSALESIGGWPKSRTGEDFLGSAMLSYAGYGVAFVREPLQIGLAPESIKKHVQQRQRWVSHLNQTFKHRIDKVHQGR